MIQTVLPSIPDDEDMIDNVNVLDNPNRDINNDVTPDTVSNDESTHIDNMGTISVDGLRRSVRIIPVLKVYNMSFSKEYGIAANTAMTEATQMIDKGIFEIMTYNVVPRGTAILNSHKFLKLPNHLN